MTVTTVFSSTADGYIDSFGSVYSDVRDGLITGLSVFNTGGDATIGQAFSTPNYQVEFPLFSFDTSAIPDADVVSAVAFSLFGFFDGTATDYTIEARITDWGASITTADWVAGGSLSALTRVATFATTGFNASAYNTFTEDGSNFQAAINVTGTTYLCCVSSRVVANTTPTGDESAGVLTAEDGGAGTTQDPKLVITHAAAVASPDFGMQQPDHATGTMLRW